MIVSDALDFLSQLDLYGAVVLFWFTVIFEIPRYVAAGIVVAVVNLFARNGTRTAPATRAQTISVVLAGHEEAAHLRQCIESIGEQTIMTAHDRCQIIVVDDGSSDGMADVATTLQAQGKIDAVLSTRWRGGKSAAVNLALRHCTGDIIIIADVDTSFDRNAFAALIEPFADPTVGAVAGSLGVRNSATNVITHCQAIEYMISISLGRRLLGALDMLPIVSGAFGAFRRDALTAVGGQSVEVGEDADLTAKIRRAGWRIQFAPDARALTDVPDTIPVLIRQRMRWERSVITIWARKFRTMFDPRSRNFSLSDVLSALDILFFQVGLCVAFVAYLFWLFWFFGAVAWLVLAATALVYTVLATISFVSAAVIADEPHWERLLPYIIAHSLLSGYFLRIVRLTAYIDEIIFRRSYRDPYVPRRVMDQVERF